MFPLSKSSMVAVGREYWKTYLPARYQVLLEAGELEQALTTAVEMTLEAMQSLRNGGFSQWEAWEATRENHLLLAMEPASGSGRRDGQCPKGNKSPAPQAQSRPHPIAFRHQSRARQAILETQRLIFLKIA
jgi:hypothetical protein